MSETATTMEERWAEAAPSGEQPAMPGVTPHLTIPDGRASEAVDFYKRAFGADEIARLLADDQRRILNGMIAINDGVVMLADDFPEYCAGVTATPPGSMTLHLQVDDADAWFARAVAAGATVAMPLDDMFWGDRYSQVVDPFGHRWSIGAPISKGDTA